METPGPQAQFESGDGTGDKGAATTQELPDNNSEPWYSARCVFLLRPADHERLDHAYEERVVLIRAESFEDAFAKAKAEAQDYIAEEPTSRLLFVEVYHLFESRIGDKSEIFSLIRDSSLSAEDYVRKFFNTGHEYRQDD